MHRRAPESATPARGQQTPAAPQAASAGQGGALERGAARPRPLRVGLGVYRLALAGLELLALFGNFNYVLGFSSFATNNFFSYFTIQSAMLAVVMLIAGGIAALLRERDPHWLSIMRTVVMCYLLVSGIVFAVIVAQASTRAYRVDVPWSDTLLHFVVPALALVGWFVDAVISPRSDPMPWSTLGWVLPFPVAWLIFTLIRGADVGWYPYFFLDPAQVGGALGIAFYCLLVLGIFLGVAAMLVAVSRRITARATKLRERLLREQTGQVPPAPAR
ncbi:Pr6Pr family membrane protein [Microterricola pindariensis]|uniref:Pr6Pr family membrane protein n=1 Tax=Microterricola pindariensis TaxID=478010 RepID=UPI001056EE74|nr:Pr6Pr family membrane protein [Microterricola pindariensis]